MYTTIRDYMAVKEIVMVPPRILKSKPLRTLSGLLVFLLALIAFQLHILEHIRDISAITAHFPLPEHPRPADNIAMLQQIDHIDSIVSDELNRIITLSVFGLFIITVIVIIGAVNFYFVRSRFRIDPLTRVHNRYFLGELTNPADYHLIVVDIDYFKKINETFGRETGDIVLHKVARTLQSQLKERRDYIIRMGGEEFLLLIRPDPHSSQRTLEIARHAMDAIQNLRIITSEEETVTLTVSMGIHLHAAHALSFEEALKQADSALYQAKNNGRNRIEHYEEGRHKNDLNNVMPFLEIKKAFDENRIVPFLQPIFDSRSLTPSHYEMLVRIRTDDEVIPPIRFLPAIRGTLLEQRLTKRMIRYAKEIILHDPKVHLSINVSVEELNDTGFLTLLLHETDDEAAARMCLEILETDTTDDFATLSANIQRLKAKGYRIAIDDFGTGYSNFINIAQLQIDYLKIDGSLVQQIESNIRTATIVEAIHAFSSKLGVLTVAEFVSSEEIQSLIQDIGIDYLQGYVLGKPAPVGEFIPGISF